MDQSMSLILVLICIFFIVFISIFLSPGYFLVQQKEEDQFQSLANFSTGQISSPPRRKRAIESSSAAPTRIKTAAFDQRR